jgi:urate oxidase
MGVAALSAAPALSHITIMCPNIHFLPTLPAGIKFENDVFIATSEPHGTIQATVSRDKDVKPRPKL